MIIKFVSRFILSVLMLTGTAPHLLAQSSPDLPDGVMQIEILSGWRTTRGTHMAAFHIRLKDGWKTYWRAPGDGGIPPQFDWSGSKNIAAVAFHWPRPEVSEANGMRTIVYHNELILPVELSPKYSGQDIRLKGRVDLGVCNKICVPVSLKFSANLSANLSEAMPQIKTALKAQPVSARRGGVKSARCLVEPISDGLRVTAIIKLPPTGGKETVVIEPADQAIWVSESVSSRHGNTITTVSDLVPPSNAPFALDRSRIRLTVLGSKRAVGITGCTG